MASIKVNSDIDEVDWCGGDFRIEIAVFHQHQFFMYCMHIYICTPLTKDTGVFEGLGRLIIV